MVAQNNTNKQPRLDPEMTFEVTFLDEGPLFDDYREAAMILAKARKVYDKTRPQSERLKFNSKKIRAGDWLVWAENDRTKDWLTEFFSTPDFSQSYKATLMASRGLMVKYKVKVPAPDSTTDFDPLLSHLFDELGCFGYVRFTNETRWYKDPKVNERYTAAIKKKKVSQFKDNDEEYDKFIWIKMSVEASRILEDNLDRLNYHYGVTKMTLERVPDRGEKRDSQGQVILAGTGGNMEPLGTGRTSLRQQPGGAEGQDDLQRNREHGQRPQSDDKDKDEATDYDEMMEMEANNAEARGRVDGVAPGAGTNRGE